MKEEIENLDFLVELWLTELDMELEWDLHEGQKKALQHIMGDSGLLAVLPTGLGKTLISVFASKYSKLIKNKQALLLAPLRALTTEHVATHTEYGLKCMIDNGEHSKGKEDYQFGDFDLVVSTFEKMDSIIRRFNPDADRKGHKQRRDIVFGNFDTIIIDEVHGIEDETRGVNLESFIMSVKKLYPHIKIVALSATIGNKKEFAEWLGVPLIHQPPSDRPVPLELRYISINTWYSKQQFAEKMEYLMADVQRNKGQKRMIAVTSVARTKTIVCALCDVHGFNKPPIAYFMNKHRIAWHYSGGRGMSEDDRMAVEWSFDYESLPEVEEFYYEGIEDFICRKDWLKENYGLSHGIDTIVCTPTLIVGRNLPVTYIDVFDHIQYSFTRGPEIIGANRLQQTIGRAGRQQFAYDKDGNFNSNYKGIATMYAQVNDMPVVRERAENPFDIISHLEKHLGEKILAWINSNIVNREEDIYTFLETALDRSISDNHEKIEKMMKFLKIFKFVVEQEDGTLRITAKGLTTIRFYIQPSTVVKWGKIVKDAYSKRSIKLDDLIVRSMDVDEFYQNVCIGKNDYQPVANMREILNYPEVHDESVKAFMFTFPSYTRKKLKINKDDYIMPDGECESIRKQFERMISAFAEIYNTSKIGKALETSKYMVSSGIFNPKLGELMSIKGIGLAYAKRLLSKGIETKKQVIELSKTNKKRLLGILSMTARKWAKIESNFTNN